MTRPLRFQRGHRCVDWCPLCLAADVWDALQDAWRALTGRTAR